jgi:WD40 repeat protein
MQYRDPRSPAAPTHANTSAHSEDIVSIAFNPANSDSSPVLLSASTDGLLNLVNPLQQDEDEAVMFTYNVGSGVARAHWSADGQFVAATTDMETAGIWTNEVDCFRLPLVPTMS